MATLTATAFSREPRMIESGVISRTIQYNSGATEISASATTVFLCKIPHGATILDIQTHHTAGADTCPADYGIDATLSAFISQATKAAVTRAAVLANIPYQVSLADTDVTRYGVLKVTFTPGTATASVKCFTTVYYTMDGNP